MGISVTKEKDEKPLRFSQDRIISCTIDTNQEKFKQMFNSKNSVKDLIHSIKKNFYKNPELNNKIINLYY